PFFQFSKFYNVKTLTMLDFYKNYFLEIFQKVLSLKNFWNLKSENSKVLDFRFLEIFSKDSFNLLIFPFFNSFFFIFKVFFYIFFVCFFFIFFFFLFLVQL